MSIERTATLRQAETLLRQGRLEQAIAEYLRVVEDQPRDWNTANLLGDLYIRAGQVDHAVAQFVRIADSLHREGFVSKAFALYKKILKLRAGDDHALVRAGELAAEQELVADARALWTTAMDARRSRGDARGALALVVRLGTLDRNDVPARLAGAHARHQLDDLPGALHELTDLATMLVESGREEEALPPLREIAALDPGGTQAQRDIARILVAQGRLDEAAPYLTREAIGHDSALLLVAADVRLRRGDTEAGLEMVDTLLAGDAQAADSVFSLARSLGATHPDTAYGLVDRIVSIRISCGDWPGAAAVLREFIATAPGHLPALDRLVAVCADEGVQAQLSDGPRASDSAVEAQHVAEEPLKCQAGEGAGAERTSAALRAATEADPGRTLSDRDGLPAPPAASAEEIETVFARMREQASGRSPEEAAEVAYARGAALLEAGECEACIEQLRLAMRAPGRRFGAASLLARAYQELGRTRDAIEWLGHAADAPGIAPAERFDTLYRLADLLETSDEPASALAVCLELQADAGEFRDVAVRIARLSRAQFGG